MMPRVWRVLRQQRHLVLQGTCLTGQALTLSLAARRSPKLAFVGGLLMYGSSIAWVREILRDE